MSKIKLSLPSGSGVEKTVISYFNNNGNYLILDAESVGSMGLPIILVSKVDNDKVIKISDQNEWQQVKAHLKTIISGGQMTYLKAPESLPADEVYYTQLTLPVASFDTLKSSYVVPEDPANTAETKAEEAKPETMADVVATATENVDVKPSPAEVVEEAKPDSGIDNSIMESTTPVANSNTDESEPVNMAIETPADPVAPAPDAPIANPIVGGSAASEAPIANESLNAVENADIVAPVVTTPVVENSEASDNAPVLNVEQVITEPVVQEAAPSESAAPVVSNANINVEDIKNKFITACEEAFDALAQLISK